jgi:bile acid-coenzyme A ligase
MAEHLARYKTPRSYELTKRALRDDAGKIRKSDLVSQPENVKS